MKLDHITVVVSDSHEACAMLARIFDTDPSGFIEVPGMSIGTFRLGAVELHINSPTGEGPVEDYFRSRGAGYHHLALSVDDLDGEIARLETLGFRTLGKPIDTAPGLREAFLDPRTTGGILLQLVERIADVSIDALTAADVASLARSLSSSSK